MDSASDPAAVGTSLHISCGTRLSNIFPWRASSAPPSSKSDDLKRILMLHLRIVQQRASDGLSAMPVQPLSL
jgi:hypothetical protein